MSATTPSDDDECHDLVLLFANSRLPRGSDAFQSIVSDLLPTLDPHSTGGIDSTDSGDPQLHNNPENKLTKEPRSKDRKEVRIVSPKPLARVHWPDEMSDKISSSPRVDQLHSARIYMKATPKPILKHDDDSNLMMDHIAQGHV